MSVTRLRSGRVTVRNNRLDIGRWVSITFERTLRIPDDGRAYPLPPGLGPFPIARADRLKRAPAAWRAGRDLIIPMYQREALWLAFEGKPWHPAAVQVGVGGINAVSGGEWAEGLTREPQNYVVCPDQPWLDGINAGDGLIRQFVAMPLGSGYTVEGQLTGHETIGGIQLRVFDARPGVFPERPPRTRPGAQPLRAASPLGLAAGGRIRQKIYPDRHGLDVWGPRQPTSVQVHILNSRDFAALTGRPPPPTPIEARTYTELGFPWFDLYDEDRPALGPADRLSGVRSVGELTAHSDDSLTIGPDQIEKLTPPGG